MMKTILIIAALMAVTLPAQAQVFRCTVGGKTVFSGIPCPTTADAAEEVQIFDRGPSTEDSQAAQARLNVMRARLELERTQQETTRQLRRQQALEAQDELQHIARSRQAIEQRRVFVGMSADDAVKSWGEPTTINRSHYASGTKEQWVYRHGPGKSQYVYVEGGRVTAIRE